MVDLVSLGELLVDFTPVGESAAGNPLFERNPGGGPANLACAAAKLGVRASFIGQVGDDAFGRDLRRILAETGVDTWRLRLSPLYQTTLAFVHLAPDGDRSFSFYRRQGADTMLEPEKADYTLIESSRCFYYSGVLLTGGPSRETSFSLAAHAKKKGVTTVYDPNLRLNLWESEDEARRVILHAMQFADIVKVSEEELLFLTGEPDGERAARQLQAAYGMTALIVTLGARGCFLLMKGTITMVPGFPVQAVDTTAAGDSFTGGFLYGLLQGQTPLAARPPERLREMLLFANAVGALTTTRKGAISALPSYEEVLDFLQKHGCT